MGYPNRPWDYWDVLYPVKRMVLAANYAVKLPGCGSTPPAATYRKGDEAARGIGGRNFVIALVESREHA